MINWEYIYLTKGEDLSGQKRKIRSAYCDFLGSKAKPVNNYVLWTHTG